MLSQVVQDALNEQINTEFYSSYSYLAMSAYCEQQQFTGCASWLRLQSEEEYGHGMKLYDFMIARQCSVLLKAIKTPSIGFKSIPTVFETALAHEKQVTKQIDALYELAFHEKAFAALVELEWFITEQVEEEKTFQEIVQKFKLVQGDPASLLDMDRDLAARRNANMGAS